MSRIVTGVILKERIIKRPIMCLQNGVHSCYLEKKHVGTDASIIKLGCNVGHNVNYLWQVVYRNLPGVEINEDAIKSR